MFDEVSLDDCEEISDLDLHGKENKFSFCTAFAGIGFLTDSLFL